MDNVLIFSKKILKEKIDKNSIVVDATCGNGNDTLFLAKTSAKKVFAFDIQEQAIFNTRQLLLNNEVDSKCELILDSHFNFDNYIKSKVRAVMFNLGYLPKGNHNITTTADTTVTTIEKFLKVLEIGGIIVIVVYWGHENGKIEKAALLDTLTALNQHNVEVLKMNIKDYSQPLI